MHNLIISDEFAFAFVANRNSNKMTTNPTLHFPWDILRLLLAILLDK
jgi:hypothetical protein